LSRQSCIGQGGAKRWGLLRVCFSQLAQGVRCLWMYVFPAFAAAESRLRPETPDSRTSLSEPYCNGMPAPPEDGLGQRTISSTILQGHLSLKGTPLRSSHFGGRQAQISNLRWTKRLMRFQCRVLHAHNMTFRKSEGFPYLRSNGARLLYHSKIFP